MKNRITSLTILGWLICTMFYAPLLASAQVSPVRSIETTPTLRNIDSLKELETKPILIDKDVLNKIEAVKIEAVKKEDAKKTDTPWTVLVQNLFTEYWLQFLALVVSVIGVMLAVSGFSLANKKKHKYLKKFLHEIDNAYSSYKMKSKRCEAEMIRLQDQIEDKLKEGSLDEGTYHLLEKRIDKYLEEIKTENGGKPAL